MIVELALIVLTCCITPIASLHSAADYEPHFLLSAIVHQYDSTRLAASLETKTLSKAHSKGYIRCLQDLAIEALVKHELVSADINDGTPELSFLEHGAIMQNLPLVARAYALYKHLPINSTDSAQWWTAPPILIDAYNAYLASENAGFSIAELLKHQILNPAHLFNISYQSRFDRWHLVHEPRKPNTLLLQSKCLNNLDGLSVPEEMHLELLSLGDNKLTVATLEPLTRLTSLIALSLDHNRLETFPPVLATLTHLRYLYLDNNRLDSIKGDVLPHLNSLEVLSLGHNNLTELPPTIACLTHLKKLSVHSNRLHAVPDSLTCLNNLLDIDFAYNKLTTLPDGFARINRNWWLTLDVRGNLFSPKIACYLLEEFKRRLGSIHI